MGEEKVFTGEGKAFLQMLKAGRQNRPHSHLICPVVMKPLQWELPTMDSV